MPKLLFSISLITLISINSVAISISENLFYKDLPSKPIEVLEAWEGSWKSNVVFKHSILFPGGLSYSQSTKCNWILKDKFQQCMYQNMKDESLNFHRYDSKRKVFEKWTFNSKGETSYWTGKWNKTTKKLKWTMIFPQGLKATIVDHFLTANKYETFFLIEDMQGNMLLDIHITNIKTIE